MREFKGCKNYTLLGVEELSDIKSIAYTLRHDKTGARIALISNDDDNKAFAISFNTPQKDSTGVPHILEHSVLCGSKKFPVKDAMTEVSKGSVNTFINAFTYADRTIYPVSSVNDKDFQNLMEVYLDAVFFPKVNEEPKIFMQEGWHYELEGLDRDITINGVVYNEMKGAYSSPEGALMSYINFSLFPDTQYGVESGGDPECIPDLTYENFLILHKKLYNPSNSRIFLYGNMDFAEKLEYIDKEYLSLFNKRETEAEILIQEPFLEPKRIVKEYSISETESEDEGVYFSYNVVCSDYKEPLVNEAIEAINYALCSVTGSRLEKALYDENICKNVYSEFFTDSCQKVFTIVAEGCKLSDEDKFIAIVERTMQDIIKEGFDKKTLEAAITSQEFSYREADFGSFPKGVAYAMVTLDDWSYKDDDIFSGLKQDAVFDELRKGIDTGLFETVLKERILDNKHKTILIMKPRHNLDEEIDNKLKDKLSLYKASLSKEELKNIIKQTRELKKYQAMPDSKNALKTVPTLTLADINREAVKTEYKVTEKEGYKEIYSDLPTNGIAYFSLCFGITHLPEELLYVVSLLRLLMGSVDTKDFTYSELPNEINIKSGGLSMTFSDARSAIKKDEYSIGLELRTKALYQNLDDVFDIISSILYSSNFDNKKRIKECIDQTLLRYKSFYEESGHAVVMGRIASYYSDSFNILDKLSGIDNFWYIERLSKEIDNNFDKVKEDLIKVRDLIFVKNNIEVVIGCDAEKKELFDKAVIKFINRLKPAIELKKANYESASVKNEAFTMSSQVQYVGMGGDFTKAGLEYTGRLRILKNILSNEYLWNTVRLQGGAYGCMCGFLRTGESYFASYRDPGLEKTIDAYKKAASYIKKYPKNAENVERFIISTIGEMDIPGSSSTKLYRAYGLYKRDISNEMIQQERDEILSTTPKDIRALSKYLEAIINCEAYCTVGSDAVINKNKALFNNVKPLFNS